MSLSLKIQSDLVAAMKSRNEVALSVLRMLKSSIQVAESEKGRQSPLSDDDVQGLVRKAIKQRLEAAEAYRSAGIEERAEDELREAEFLKSYLPAQLDDGELVSIVEEAARSVGATGTKDLGRAMGAAMKATAGKADGKRVKAALSAYLESL